MSYTKQAQADDGMFNLNLGSDFVKRYQDPTTEWAITNAFNFDGYHVVSDDDDLDYDFQYEFSDSISGHYHKWLNGSRGLMMGVQLSMDFATYTNGDAPSSFMNKPKDGVDFVVNMAMGFGYGRVIDARVIVVAAAMYEAVGLPATAEDLAKAAEIMGRYAAGVYDTKYKDGVVARATYYADLAKHIGTDNPFKLYEVESSPIYNIGIRRSGAELNLWFHLSSGDHGDDDGDADAGKSVHIEQEGQVAVLIADTMCFYLQEQFVYGLNHAKALPGQRVGTVSSTGFGIVGGFDDTHPGQDNLHLALEAGLSVDHSPQWNTNFQINFNYGKLDDRWASSSKDSGYDYHLYIRTTFAMATKLLGSAWIGMSGFSDPANPIFGYSGLHLSDMRGLGYEAGEIGYGMGIQFSYYIF